MVTRGLSVCTLLLAPAFLTIDSGCLLGRSPLDSADVIVSDDAGFNGAEFAPPAWTNDYYREPVAPAQFQLRPRSGRAGGGGSARQAGLSGSGQRGPQTSQTHLANTPKMLGDFFGQGFSTSNVDLFIGRSVHHISPSLFAANDFHRIDETGSKVLFVGGPQGTSAGAFFVKNPSVAPPAPDLVEGLSSNIAGTFFAEKTTDLVDVYDDVMDASPMLFDVNVFNIYQEGQFALPSGGPGDIIGRVRIQENNSAMPQDRVYFDYSYFHNVAFSQGQLDVNRFAPGFEKTCFGGLASLEVRVPMGISLNNQIISDQATDLSHAEFGNIVVSPKVLLYGTGECAIAAGCGVAMPTADDITVGQSNGTQLLRVENESVHLLPYLGLLYTPRTSNCFVHAFLTLDVDTNGNPTFANVTGSGLEGIGTWNDQNLLTANIAVGSWLTRSQSRNSRVQGVAWSAEVHSTTSLNEADVVAGNNYSIGNPGADLSLVNGTLGGHVVVGMTTFTVGYSTALTSSDRVFDGELRAFLNRAF